MDRHRREWFYTCWGWYHWEWVDHGLYKGFIYLSAHVLSLYCPPWHKDLWTRRGKKFTYRQTGVFDAGKKYVYTWITETQNFVTRKYYKPLRLYDLFRAYKWPAASALNTRFRRFISALCYRLSSRPLSASANTTLSTLLLNTDLLRCYNGQFTRRNISPGD